MDKPWKRAERKIAAKLGGERIPITGRQRGSEPDIRHRTYSIEVKERASLPGWLDDAMDQAVKSARCHQTPMVVLHNLGRRHDADYVVFRLGDFRKHLAPILDREAGYEGIGAILGVEALGRAAADNGAPTPLDNLPRPGNDD